MLLRQEMVEGDSDRHLKLWGHAFHEQEPALGGSGEVTFETASTEFAAYAPSTNPQSIPRAIYPPACPIATTSSVSSMPIPTRLSNESSSSSSHQVILVAATTGGAIVFVFLVFAIIFIRVRGRQRRQELTETLVREAREGKGAGGMGMLDGEGFVDSVRGRQMVQQSRSPHSEYHVDLSPAHCERPQDSAARPPTLRSPIPPPFLFPPRASDSGSAFREEVWPPPRQESIFVDPLLQTPADDLARIVTDIMGHPNATFLADRERPSSSSSLTRAASAYSPFFGSGAASPRSRRNSCSTIYAYAQTPLRSSASTPTLPLTASDESSSTSEDDPPWPPTPGALSGGTSTPPVSFWQRPGAPVLVMKERSMNMTGTPPPLPVLRKTPLRPRTADDALRYSAGDGSESPRVKNWLERTPRRLERASSGVHAARRAASVGH